MNNKDTGEVDSVTETFWKTECELFEQNLKNTEGLGEVHNKYSRVPAVPMS